MARGALSLVVAVALAAGLAACGGSSEEEGAEPAGGTTAPVVEISATEFALDPSSITVDQAGPVTLRVTSNGSATHALTIEGGGVERETGELERGESAELTVDLDAGSYVIYCPIGDHRDRGMEGAIGIGGAPAAPPESDGDSDRGGGYGY
jgi:plastocyanin